MCPADWDLHSALWWHCPSCSRGGKYFGATFLLCAAVTTESNQKAAKVENGRNKFTWALGHVLHAPSAVAEGTKHRLVHPPALHPATPGKPSSGPNFGHPSEADPARS